MMPKLSGIEILQRLKESQPDTDVIMITGLSQIDTAVQSMKLGAFDYIPKPFTPEEITLSIERSLERRRLLRENTLLRTEAGSKYRFENIIGSAPQMQNVYRLIAKCAPTSSNRAHPRGERHRQGAHRARDPLQQPAQGQALRPGGLRLPERDPPRKRALRPREGRVHGRDRQQARPLQGGRRRHALPRRDRQHRARHADEAPARHPGAGVQGRRRHAHPEHQHPAQSRRRIST